MKKCFLTVIILLIILFSSLADAGSCQHAHLKGGTYHEATCQSNAYRENALCTDCNHVQYKVYIPNTKLSECRYVYKKCGDYPKCQWCNKKQPNSSKYDHIMSIGTCSEKSRCIRSGCNHVGTLGTAHVRVNTASGRCYDCGKQLFNPKH